jgi:hypothetical protein
VFVCLLLGGSYLGLVKARSETPVDYTEEIDKPAAFRTIPHQRLVLEVSRSAPGTIQFFLIAGSLDRLSVEPTRMWPIEADQAFAAPDIRRAWLPQIKRFNFQLGLPTSPPTVLHGNLESWQGDTRHMLYLGISVKDRH